MICIFCLKFEQQGQTILQKINSFCIIILFSSVLHPYFGPQISGHQPVMRMFLVITGSGEGKAENLYDWMKQRNNEICSAK